MKYIGFDRLHEMAQSDAGYNELIKSFLNTIESSGVKMKLASSVDRDNPYFHWPNDVIKYKEGSCFEFSVMLRDFCLQNNIPCLLMIIGLQTGINVEPFIHRKYETVHMYPLIMDSKKRKYRIVDMTVTLDFDKYDVVSTNKNKAKIQSKDLYQRSLYNQICNYLRARYINLEDILVSGPLILNDRDLSVIDFLKNINKQITNSDFASYLQSYNDICAEMDMNKIMKKCLMPDNHKIDVLKEIEYGPEWTKAYLKAIKELKHK